MVISRSFVPAARRRSEEVENCLAAAAGKDDDPEMDCPIATEGSEVSFSICYTGTVERNNVELVANTKNRSRTSAVIEQRLANGLPHMAM